MNKQIEEEFLDLKKRIFSISNPEQFQKIALQLFQLQYQTNPHYQKYCRLIKKSASSVISLSDIPFIPIQFFKEFDIRCGDFAPEMIFKSSGTGGKRSRHLVKDLEIYQKSFQLAFEGLYGPIKDWAVLVLLPSYQAQGDSSLVYMVDHFIRQSRSDLSGYFLDEDEKLIESLKNLSKANHPTLLIGVSYALLDLIDKHAIPKHKCLMVMETGGMKGRKREMIREELHHELQNGFHLPVIHSEYGMTELMSQAYAKKDGLFECPPWMKVQIRAQEDPFSEISDGQIGGINVIDLANLYSCAFIQTDDLGRSKCEKFEVVGRFDGSDVRGCNLLIT